MANLGRARLRSKESPAPDWLSPPVKKRKRSKTGRRDVCVNVSKDISAISKAKHANNDTEFRSVVTEAELVLGPFEPV
ncbi:unnamed protein product [Clonostachys solani]|uniref:Uncharacterized protein n=1 Tax=Clonostachys solani TaxID=160281 RepID=A0A9N9YSW9_9HYPO|nr:unnamed protein product [Clonostachys solani]